MPIKSVDNASVFLQVASDGADPGATIQHHRNRIVLHLTRHSPELLAFLDKNLVVTDDDIGDPISAINISGFANVHPKSPHDAIHPEGRSVCGWDFHFMQVVRDTQQIMYAGRNASEGYVLISPTAAPAYDFAMSWCLDSSDDPQKLPFYSPQSPTIDNAYKYSRMEAGKHPGHEMDTLPGLRRISTEMNDHPSLTQALTFTSGIRSLGKGRQFFLFRVVRAFEAVAVFVARNEQKVIQPLASVSWSAIWNVRLSWTNGRPTLFMDKHAFKVDKFVKGPLSNKDQSKIINNPPTDVGETGNAALKRALKYIDVHQSPPNLSFAERWPTEIPNDFYK